jgi:hypothetical protein
MMTRVTALCLLFLSMTTGHPWAQQRPDFSGEWRPIGGDAAPPAPPGGGPPPPPRTLAITITQSPGELKIARRVESEGREAVYNFTYKVDGTETVNPMGPLVFYSRASWQGESLVVASDVGVDDRRIGTLRETYVLEDGKLTVETSRTGPAGTMKSKTVHEKVIPPSRKAPGRQLRIPENGSRRADESCSLHLGAVVTGGQPVMSGCRPSQDSPAVDPQTTPKALEQRFGRDTLLYFPMDRGTAAPVALQTIIDAATR